jgi:hypothetical protein
VEVSGTATVTSFGTNYNGPRFIRFTGACTLTHNATTLILPGAANITTAANDSCLVVPKNALDGWAVISYQKADGTAISSATFTDYLNSTRSDVASAATVNLTSSAPNTRHINITGTTAITAFTVAIGQCYFVRFAGVLTLTNNASIVTNTGANITTAAGDTCLIRATAANTIEVLFYSPVSVTASHLSGGGAGQIPYQSASGTTAMLAAGTSGQVLRSNGESAPSWVNFSAGLTLGTQQNTTSGTSIDFTGIPSTATEINIMFEGVSWAALATPRIQIGDSGGIETTGYTSKGYAYGGALGALDTTGFVFSDADIAASQILTGCVTLVLKNASANTWVVKSAGLVSITATGAYGGVGGKSLSATLDRVRITSVAGATFNAGSVNISYM